MSMFLDMVTGGGNALPHVYVRSVRIERAQNPALADIFIQLELYQDKYALPNSSWMNNLSIPGLNGVTIMDSMFIQPVAIGQGHIAGPIEGFSTSVNSSRHIRKLLPSNMPTVSPTLDGFGSNVYTAKRFLGDGFLPRSAQDFYTERDGSGIFPGGVSNIPNQIPIAMGSLLGDITQTGVFPTLEAEGRLREEIKDGKPYYVIPFQYEYRNFNPQAENNDLGFLFYTYLDLPLFLAFMTAALGNLDTSYFENEEYVVEGPISTTVVFENGAPSLTREVFLKPDGEVWNGAVHLHTEDNPSPDGYFGDGSKGIGKGWMVGESHIPGADQPRLNLIEVPNNLITDYRTALQPEPLDGALGLGTQTQVFNLGSEMDLADKFLSPFQKEKKKDLLRDNDTEFSKLYVSRDRDNNARGMFFINTLDLLRNNSKLFPMLFGQEMVNGFLTNVAEFSYGSENFFKIRGIIEQCKILQLRLYRDRVSKHVLNTRYENYSNDKEYEEPSQLIGVISDIDNFLTPSQNSELAEVSNISSPQAGQTKFATRYFMFSDRDVGERSAGLYQYRIELDFKDATYDRLYRLYKDLANARVALESYYDIAVSSFVKDTQLILNYDNTLANTRTVKPDTYTKSAVRKYYQDGAFVQEFIDKAYEVFAKPGASLPWERPLFLLDEVQDFFDMFPVLSVEKNKRLEFTGQTGIAFQNMLRPSTGSPQGINYVSRMVETVMNKLSSLLDLTVVNKSGSELDNNSVPNGYTFNSVLEAAITPSDQTIRESYTFDHPSELFRALSNEDIYIDYLSIGQPQHSQFEGLRSYSPGYYLDRCRLDAVKFSPSAHPSVGNGFTQYDTSVGADFGPDTFSNTGYSYLAPSIVELSDPLRQETPQFDTSELESYESYNYYYSAFSTDGRDHLNSNPNSPDSVPLYSEDFDTLEVYDSLLVALINYSRNKTDQQDTDLTGVKLLRGHPAFDLIEDRLEARESFKRLFDDFSITVHDSSVYNKFFDREPGAISGDIPDKQEYNNTFGLGPTDYSDSNLMTQGALKAILFSDHQQVIKPPPGGIQPYSYDVDLPNPFKFRAMRNTKKFLTGEEVAQPIFAAAYDSLPLGASTDVINSISGPYSSFFFFQHNLTSRIEVFRGAPFAKDDEESWSLLTSSDLELTGDEKLFCRIKYYDETLVGDLDIPVLDKYFLIYEGGDIPDLPPVTPPASYIDDLMGTMGQNAVANFWSNYEISILSPGGPTIVTAELAQANLQAQLGGPRFDPQGTVRNDIGQIIRDGLATSTEPTYVPGPSSAVNPAYAPPVASTSAVNPAYSPPAAAPGATVASDDRGTTQTTSQSTPASPSTTTPPDTRGSAVGSSTGGGSTGAINPSTGGGGGRGGGGGY